MDFPALQRFADTCLKAKTAEDISVPLTRLLGDAGITSWYVGSLVHESKLRRPGFGFFGMVEGWRERYAEAHHSDHDAVFQYALANERPLTWQECRARHVARNGGARSLLVFDEALNEFGLRDGYIKPIHLGSDLPAAVTFGGPEVDLSEGGQYALNMVATWAYEGFRRQIDAFNPFGPKLTARESQVLYWTAQGKSAWEIAQVLGITENTVRVYHRKLKQKYDVPTLIQVVLAAVGDGNLPKPGSSTQH